MYDEIWKRIIIVHQYSKDLLLKGEEINLKLDGFIQPFKEQRDALEHIIRVQAAKYNIVSDIEEDKEKYISGNLEKVLGHEYRAFFDIADWVSINIRVNVTNFMSPYTPECITKAFPSYYADIRPQIEKANLEIAKIRCDKDIPKNDNIIPSVEKYHAIIDKLIEISSNISIYIPQLEECKRAIRRSKIVDIIIRIGLVILGVILGVFIKC